MSDAVGILERLKAHRTLGDAPVAELEWLAAHGTLRKFRAGAAVTKKGIPVTVMMILLEGHVAIRVDRGVGAHKIMEWKGGDVSGVLPYSRGAVSPNDGCAEVDTELVEIPRDHFPELIRECPTVTAKLVHVMLDRARIFTSTALRDEKLVSLGRLAAGLAHELNNPASAARRAAALLAGTEEEADAAARQLAAARLTDAQLAAIDAARAACHAREPRAHLSGLERSDREEAIADWLRAHGANASAAGALVETRVELADLDALATVLEGPALDAALRWLAAGSALRSLAGAIEMSAARISEIVQAVKGFTFMDQAPTPEPVDIRRGITDAITMLEAKVRAKAAEVTVAFAEGLPPALAVGAEINQVWMNLLDNALDAIGAEGRIRVSAAREFGHVVVHVVDDGPGIPPEVLARIFEPFFTTKGVGEGTGLGLDIVRRLLQRHEGGIEVESQAGRTDFRVWLPAADATPEELREAPMKRTSAIHRRPGADRTA